MNTVATDGRGRGRHLLVAAGWLLALSGGTATAADEWEFSLSPLFLWGVSIDGDSTINGRTAPLDLDFGDDILENMEAVFTFHFEARKGEWGLFAEYQYLDLEPDPSGGSLGPVSVSADVDFESTMWELGGTWAFSENDRTRWELLGGARYTDQDIKVDIDISAPPPGEEPSQRLKGGDDWWHPFAGVRVFHALSERWSIIGRADYGYGGSDNTAFNAAFMFDWRFKNWGSAFIGARYLNYDYDDDSYGYDAAQQGPLAGLTLHW